MKPSDLPLFFVGSFKITDSISRLVMSLFKWFLFDSVLVCCKFLESSPFLLGFIDFFFCCFLNLYFISSLIFIISVLLKLGFFVLLFLILLGDQLGCLLEIFHLLRNACITMNFALRTAFATSHKVLYGCVFIVIWSQGVFNFPFGFLIDPLVF